MAAPPIIYPLTLPMCAPISDGAAAAIVCNRAGLKRLNGAAQRAVRVLYHWIQVQIARLRLDEAAELGLPDALLLHGNRLWITTELG